MFVFVGKLTQGRALKSCTQAGHCWWARSQLSRVSPVSQHLQSPAPSTLERSFGRHSWISDWRMSVHTLPWQWSQRGFKERIKKHWRFAKIIKWRQLSIYNMYALPQGEYRGSHTFPWISMFKECGDTGFSLQTDKVDKSKWGPDTQVIVVPLWSKEWVCRSLAEHTARSSAVHNSKMNIYKWELGGLGLGGNNWANWRRLESHPCSEGGEEALQSLSLPSTL